RLAGRNGRWHNGWLRLVVSYCRRLVSLQRNSSQVEKLAGFDFYFPVHWRITAECYMKLILTADNAFECDRTLARIESAQGNSRTRRRGINYHAAEAICSRLLGSHGRGRSRFHYRHRRCLR